MCYELKLKIQRFVKFTILEKDCLKGSMCKLNIMIIHTVGQCTTDMSQCRGGHHGDQPAVSVTV